MPYALQPIACSDQKSRSRFFLRVVTLLMVGTGLSSPAFSLSTPRVQAQHFVAASARLIATHAPSDLPVPCNRVATAVLCQQGHWRVFQQSMTPQLAEQRMRRAVSKQPGRSSDDPMFRRVVCNLSCGDGI